MTGLIDDRFAPVTYSIGFVRQPLRDLREFVTQWNESIKKKAVLSDLQGTLPEFFRAAEPLTVPETKMLLVATSGGDWTAVFLNSAEVSPPSSIVAYVCREMRSEGLCVTCVPTVFGDDGRQILHGVTRFEKFASADTGYLNYERTIEVAFEDGEWSFEASGAEQPFERTATYKSRKIRDRFTPAMLEEYCAALGIYPFDSTYYSANAVVIESLGVEIYKRASYHEAQKELGISVLS